MATFLAHIKVHEGKEKRFEIAGQELFSATHDKEDEVFVLCDTRSHAVQHHVVGGLSMRMHG